MRHTSTVLHGGAQWCYLCSQGCAWCDYAHWQLVMSACRPYTNITQCAIGCNRLVFTMSWQIIGGTLCWLQQLAVYVLTKRGI